MSESDGHGAGELLLDLPTREDDEGDGAATGVDDPDAQPDLYLRDDGDHDPLDDANADDIPYEPDIAFEEGGESALGDDQSGIGDDGHHGLASFDAGQSFVETGKEQTGLDDDNQHDLGIEPAPREVDDGGLEGLEEATDGSIDVEAFPPLDGRDDDDDGEPVDADLEADLDLEALPTKEEADDEDDDL